MFISSFEFIILVIALVIERLTKSLGSLQNERVAQKKASDAELQTYIKRYFTWVACEFTWNILILFVATTMSSLHLDHISYLYVLTVIIGSATNICMRIRDLLISFMNAKQVADWICELVEKYEWIETVNESLSYLTAKFPMVAIAITLVVKFAYAAGN